MQANVFPWLDRAGRLSWLKLVVFVGLVLPGLWIALSLEMGWLAPKPVTEAIHETGQWAVKFLLLSLLVTTLRRVGQLGRLIVVRRMLGVASLAYAAIHIALYAVDQHFDLVHVASEIARRVYLTIGFAAFVGLAALGATSTDGMVRRLGSGRWKRLHGLVYGIGALALLHFMIQAKLDVTEPVLMTGLFLILLGQRALRIVDAGERVLPLGCLSLAAAALTALFEAFWYHTRNGIAVTDVLSANLAFDAPLRPAWSVLVAGLALVAVRLARRAWSRRPLAAASAMA
ncbi:MAG TPA: protein-methionine-sulfoxide reductase heme-binding subunit MsrQ [Lichenihabitans sp.]|nr:protein-methionine-sulfoxide reductase heme-binding subunit MsrQ [Lichenihabitans sp.]